MHATWNSRLGTRTAPARRVQRAARRGAVIVQVAVMTTIMMGMGALAIDIGSMYTARSEMQAAADSAALAAAGMLAGDGVSDPADLARAAADDMARRNRVMGGHYGLGGGDVELGRAVYDAGTHKFEFQSGGSNFDAVRVTVRRPSDSGGGALQLTFANIFGVSSKSLAAQAAAVLVPRDIAVCIDLSGSMNDDSELRHYRQFVGDEGETRDGVQVNLRDIWCALNGPEADRPYIPGADNETQYAGDTGPTVGGMNTWGTNIVPETWSCTSDPGLWYIPKNANCTVAAATTALTAAGYTSDERSILMAGSRDGSYANQYSNRVAVILGLATWKSGRPGGRSGGDGDVYVENSEITYIAYPSYRSGWTWTDFVSYVASSSTAMRTTDTNLRYRFGLKTFTNFLLESEPEYNRTTNLWQTPEQPLRAVKDAVQSMTDVILDLASLDHMSLEVFATTAHHEVNLSDSLQAVPDRLYRMQSGHYDTTTNIGGGLAQARAELTSARSRASAHKVIVMMSDGKPNVDENGRNVADGSSAATNYCLEQAQAAADAGMRIYTISVGADADMDLMEEIAATAHGQHFHAEGTPDEYADQLQLIFRTLGGRRPVALIE